jgi:hypothetical protein
VDFWMSTDYMPLENYRIVLEEGLKVAGYS